MIEENVKKVLESVPKLNPFGEKVTVVAAVKYQTPEDINRAIAAGITDIGDNHVQEFRDKYDKITGSPTRHFIGGLQTNKIKYLLGRVDLYQSVDRLHLAEELSRRSAAASLTSNILLEVNIGGEVTKGGFAPDAVCDAYKLICALPALKVKGLMAMLPLGASEAENIRLAKQMRALYDNLRTYDGEINCLSVGMSGDYELCIEAGSNMVRIGTALFGARDRK